MKALLVCVFFAPVCGPSAVVRRVFLTPSLAFGIGPCFVGERRIGQQARPIDLTGLRFDMTFDVGDYAAIGIPAPYLYIGMPGEALLKSGPVVFITVVGELRLIDVGFGRPWRSR